MPSRSSGTVARLRKRRRSGNRILHEHTIGTEERTNAKTKNVNKTSKQLFSGHSESQIFGAESSGLGTAALAKRSALAAMTMDYTAGP